MSQPEISPLAKRLAEENNVDWHALQGSGPAGKVVERDVLEYLSRVMAGEEDLNPTPEPTPDGMDSWPEEDVANYQQQQGGAAAPSAVTMNDGFGDNNFADDSFGDDAFADDSFGNLDDDLLVDGMDDAMSLDDDVDGDVFLLGDDDSGVLLDSSDDDLDFASDVTDMGGDLDFAADDLDDSALMLEDTSVENTLLDDASMGTPELYGRASRGQISGGQISGGQVPQQTQGFASDQANSLDSDAFGDDAAFADDAMFASDDALTDDDMFADDALDEASGDLFDDGLLSDDLDSGMDFGDSMDLDGGMDLDSSMDLDGGVDFADEITDSTDGAALSDDFAFADGSDDDLLAADSAFADDMSDDSMAFADAELGDAGLGDAGLGDAGLDDEHDADIMALDDAMLLGGDDDVDGFDDGGLDADTFASDGFDTESDHVHFDNTEIGEGATPLPEEHLHSDTMPTFDTSRDHDHTGADMVSPDMSQRSLDDTFEESVPADDIFASDDDVFSSASADDGGAAFEDDVFATDDLADTMADSMADGMGDDTFGDTMDFDAEVELEADTTFASDALDSAALGMETDLAEETGFNAAAATVAGVAGVGAAAMAQQASMTASHEVDVSSHDMQEVPQQQVAMPSQVAAPVAAQQVSSVSLVEAESRNITLRRYLDLELFNELQEQIIAALGETATVAMVQKAALKALEEVPLTGQAVNVIDLSQGKPRVQAIPNAADMSLSGLVRAMYKAQEGPSDMLVADLSKLEVDELSFDSGVPVLSLGRILWNNDEQNSLAMLSLSGNLNAEMAGRFLTVAAEMLENPLLLLL